MIVELSRVTIHWGDGESTENNSVLTHTYQEGGTYQIICTGGITGDVVFSVLGPSQSRSSVTRIDQWGTDQMCEMGYKCLSGYTQLNSLPSSCENIGRFSENQRGGDFSSCGLYYIPAGFYDKCDPSLGTDLSELCTLSKIRAIPTSAIAKFAPYCKVLYKAFMQCTSISTIGGSYFKDFTNVSNIEYLFYGCTGLHIFPENLFEYLPSVNNAGYLFTKCTRLTSIPENFFKPLGYRLQSVAGAFENTGLTSIPDGLFYNNIYIANFTDCFANCNIQSGKTPSATVFGTYELWERNSLSNPVFPSGVTGSRCFKGQTGLSNWNSIPSEWK
ncbi:MAG: hypothetical protein LUG98_15170 [Tannerellaceae bacterium]|nr:hypothetical protein [Tannerellaceae bacterium]